MDATSCLCPVNSLIDLYTASPYGCLSMGSIIHQKKDVHKRSASRSYRQHGERAYMLFLSFSYAVKVFEYYSLPADKGQEARRGGGDRIRSPAYCMILTNGAVFDDFS